MKILDFDYALLHEFQAFEEGFSISLLRHRTVNGTSTLCAVAECAGRPVSVKLWNLEELLIAPHAYNYTHHYISTFQVQNGANQYPLTCFTACKDFLVCVFGFANGNTILVRGNIVADKGLRQRTIYESKGEPITGVHLFYENEYFLYVLTTLRILLFDTTGRNQSIPLKVLEKEHGANLFCSDVSGSQLICSGETIDFYDPKYGRANSFKTGKNVARVCAFGDRHLLVVESTGDALFSVATTKITIYDYGHQFIVFSVTLPSTVSQIFKVSGEVRVLCHNGVLYAFKEKSTEDKIKILVQRELFPLAIQLAEEGGQNVTTLKRKYAEFLYGKGEYQEAVDMYIEGVEKQGEGNNSYILDVMLKYKDNDKIGYLTEFLEHICFSSEQTANLFSQSGENESGKRDYLTLLLCNYCKLKDRKKLNVFISELEKAKSVSEEDYDSSALYNNVSFNLDLILDLLTKIGFINEVLKMSFIFNYHLMILDVLSAEQRYHDIILFLRSLKINQLFSVLLSVEDASGGGNYIKGLLDQVPDEITKLLIEVFTGVYEESVAPSDIYALFSGESTEAKFVEILRKQDKTITYQPPKPRLVFLLFTNHPRHFVVFLEAVLENYLKPENFGHKKTSKDKTDILVTLFELYLTLGEGATKGVALYKENRDIMDYNTVLLMCHVNNLPDELLHGLQEDDAHSTVSQLDPLSPRFDAVVAQLDSFLQGKMSLTLEGNEEGAHITESACSVLLRSTLRNDAFDKTESLLNAYGARYPAIYTATLAHVVQCNSKDYLQNEFGERNLVICIIQMLRSGTTISRIVDMLGSSDAAEFRLIRPFLTEHLAAQAAETEKNEKLYVHYTQEISERKAQCEKLAKEVVVVNPRLCALCGSPMELPAVHFMCGHSFHQRCLDSDNVESELLTCPQCVGDVETVKALRAQQEEAGAQNAVFAQSLDTGDRLKVIADFLGKGAMESARFVRFDS